MATLIKHEMAMVKGWRYTHLIRVPGTTEAREFDRFTAMRSPTLGVPSMTSQSTMSKDNIKLIIFSEHTHIRIKG